MFDVMCLYDAPPSLQVAAEVQARYTKKYDLAGMDMIGTFTLTTRDHVDDCQVGGALCDDRLCAFATSPNWYAFKGLLLTGPPAQTFWPFPLTCAHMRLWLCLSSPLTASTRGLQVWGRPWRPLHLTRPAALPQQPTLVRRALPMKIFSHYRCSRP